MKKNILIEYLCILAGTTLMAIATNIFYESNDIVTGGITGLSIVIQYLSGKFFGFAIPLWMTTIVLNIPLLILGMRANGRKFIFRTIISIILLSIMLYLTKGFEVKDFDMTISSIYGGLLIGIGLGLVFRSGATTGGTDLSASIINSKHKQIPIATIMFSIDAFVIASGFFTFGAKKAMYAIIAEFITSRILDMMLEGFIFSKSVFIISEKTDEIADKILNQMRRGVTSLTGRGMYTKKEKNILFCVMTNKEVFNLKTMINTIDPKAFIIVTDAHEVLGNGFRELEI